MAHGERAKMLTAAQLEALDKYDRRWPSFVIPLQTRRALVRKDALANLTQGRPTITDEGRAALNKWRSAQREAGGGMK